MDMWPEKQCSRTYIQKSFSSSPPCCPMQHLSLLPTKNIWYSLPMEITRETLDASARFQACRIGRLIRSTRKENGLTQAQFAERIGISIPTLHRLEEGDTSVSLHTFLTALCVLGLQTDVLHYATRTVSRSLPRIPPTEKREFARRLESCGINSRDAENAAWILSLSDRQRIHLLQNQEKEQRLCGIARR